MAFVTKKIINLSRHNKVRESLEICKTIVTVLTFSNILGKNVCIILNAFRWECLLVMGHRFSFWARGLGIRIGEFWPALDFREYFDSFHRNLGGKWEELSKQESGPCKGENADRPVAGGGRLGGDIPTGCGSDIFIITSCLRTLFPLAYVLYLLLPKVWFLGQQLGHHLNVFKMQNLSPTPVLQNQILHFDKIPVSLRSTDNTYNGSSAEGQRSRGLWTSPGLYT